jgi:hypothetical protein
MLDSGLKPEMVRDLALFCREKAGLMCLFCEL